MSDLGEWCLDLSRDGLTVGVELLGLYNQAQEDWEHRTRTYFSRYLYGERGLELRNPSSLGNLVQVGLDGRIYV